MSTIYDTLNKEQREAVFYTDGPMLILAGAGSGKTRTLTHRIAYLIDEMDINPWNILAITFTNKAAGEMRERVDSLVEFGAESIWVSTFHSTCVRILRRHIENIGYTNQFTIYDSDDQKTLLHQVMKKLDLDPKQYKDRVLLKNISSAKDSLISPERYAKEAAGDFRRSKMADVYTEYQAQLKKNNALDFDDLIVKTVELFKECPEVLEYYQNRFRYILVDEYQDTNTAQFELVRLLADKFKNLCVVGDDDQSIYKFRGANIQNILNFERYYPTAKVIRLEQNYRSTQNILNAANSVIANNEGRKVKSLWTENDVGSKVRLKLFDTAQLEAVYITDELSSLEAKGASLADCAILYRTNAQSRVIEERLVNRGIPYQLVGGVNFYQRKEIKDVIAYLKTIGNGHDDLAVARIINVPKRGIGNTTVGKVMEFADDNGLSFLDSLREAENIHGLSRGRALANIEKFLNQVDFLKAYSENYSIADTIEKILEHTGYGNELREDDSIEGQTRYENVQELINKAVDYENSHDESDLNAFLEEVALVADIDSVNDEEERVLLMTLHSSKGLEFDRVFLCGMEDGLFPSYMSIESDDPGDLEEERRLAYVGITRAKKVLTMTACRVRMVNGRTQMNAISRFCKEIPSSLLDSNLTARERGERSSYSFGGYEGSSYLTSSKEGSSYGRSGFVRRDYDASKDYYTESRDTMFDRKPKKAKPVLSLEEMNKQFKVGKASSLDYSEGDRVSHVKFGQGTVVEIVDGQKDYQVTVDFDSAGTKKMFAAFAKLKKI